MFLATDKSLPQRDWFSSFTKLGCRCRKLKEREKWKKKKKKKKK